MNGNELIGKAATGAHVAVDKATHIAHNAVDSATGAVEPAAEWFDAKADAVRAKADAVCAMPERLAESGRAIVTTHPWALVAGALALGLLLGRILR